MGGTFPPGAGRKHYWEIEGFKRRRPDRDDVITGTTVAQRELLDVASRIRHMDELGVETHVIYPTLFLQASAVTPEGELAVTRGYNRWLSDYASYAPARLLGMAAIPIDTPERAAEEIRFAASQPGLAGGYIPLFPSEGDYGDDKWNPMWEAFVDAGIPIGLHVGGRRPGTPTVNIYESAPRFMTGLVMSKLTMAESVGELIHGLVMQRYPELRFISVEGQIGWISFFLYYADHLWEKHRYWTKSELTEPPSFYFQRQVWATFMEDPVGLRERHHIGIDRIMWASDYPHSETTWPNSKSLTDEWFGPYGDDDKTKILWKNCAELFGLL